jgi:hypothetical protein
LTKLFDKIKSVPTLSIALFTVLAAIARWRGYSTTYAQLSRVVLAPLTQCPLALRVRRFIRSSECLLLAQLSPSAYVRYLAHPSRS